MAQAKAKANAPGRPFLSAYSAATVVVAAGIVLSWQSGHLAKFVSISQAHLDRIRQDPSDSQAQPPAAKSTQSPAHALVAPDGEEEAACRLSGQVVDCGCDFASVERMNHQYLYPLLSSIVQQPFFRFFKVNLYCDCHFWPDDGMCMRKDCCVSECDESEIPAAWRAHDKALEEARKRECKGHTSQVDRSVPAVVQGALSSVVDWQALNNPWLPEDESHTNDPEYIYVDLTKNAEKYTGYKGEDARRIWAAIYDQSALKEAAQAVSTQGMEPVAREQQVLYRLISGMHASITVSIVNNYYDEATGTWGPNLPFFKARFGSPASRPYVENLYFTLLFVLRAVTKARSALLKLDYSSGFSAEEAAKTQKQVADLVNYPELQAACPTPFDEGMLWRHDPQHSELLRQRLQTAFHNITRLMDCVGCEKCKLNGKFQMLGIATALRVLFSQEQQWHETTPGGEETQEGLVPSGGPRELILERNAAIALVNFLAKLSESVEVLRMLSQHVKDQETAAAAAAK